MCAHPEMYPTLLAANFEVEQRSPKIYVYHVYNFDHVKGFGVCLLEQEVS